MGTNYFPHDANARNSDKLLRVRMKHGAAGYGVFFMLLEWLRDSDNYTSVKDYNMIAFGLRVDASLVKSVIEDFGLFAFTEDGECFYSESLTGRLGIMDESRNKRSEAAKKAAESRWSKGNDANAMQTQCDGITDAMQEQCDSMPNKNKTKIKEKKNNKKKIFDLSFVDSDYLPIMNEWLEYKHNKGKTYKDDNSVKKCYNKLLNLSNNNHCIAKRIIDESIANNWDGFFALSPDKVGDTVLRDNSIDKFKIEQGW